MNMSAAPSAPPSAQPLAADDEAGADELDCYSPYMIMTNGIWLGDEPLQYALPLFFLQVLVLSVATRLVRAAIKPLGQPAIVAEMLTGLLMGPFGVRSLPGLGGIVFPARSMNVLGSAGDLGLMYYAFLVGLEMDAEAVKKLGAKALAIGACSIVVPAAATLLALYPFRHGFDEDALDGSFFLQLGVALSVTSFPAVARILGELRHLSSDIGQLSLLASTANHVLSSVLIAVLIAATGRAADADEGAAPVVFLFGSMFVVACAFLVRPALAWAVSLSPEGEQMGDVELGLVLMGAAVAGFSADVIGIHYAFGAFVYGLCVPHGPHSTLLANRLEGSVTCFLLPIFFASSGLKSDFSDMAGLRPAVLLVAAYLLSSILKVVSTVLVSLHYSMPLHEALSLGFLMNTKGLVDTIFVDVAANRNVLMMHTVGVLTIMSAAMNALVIPAVTAAYKPSRRLRGHARRNLMRMKPEEEMNMVACIHTGRNVPSIISLLDFTNPTKRSPVNIYPLHLVELTGRGSAMIVVHDVDRTTRGSSRGGRNHVQSEHIISAFETYEQQTAAGGISLQPITAICPYSSMHEDVCCLAEDNEAAIIILPFHKIQIVDGSTEANPAIRTINQNILNQAPCSVGILVDHSLNTGKPSLQATHNIAVLFFGGPDDREALAYAWRMAGHPSIFLTLVRFIPWEEGSTSANSSRDMSNGHLRLAQTHGDQDQALDDEYVSEFRLKHLNCENVMYREVVVSNVEETVEAVQSLTSNHDFYLVGRAQRQDLHHLTAGLTEWSECPELGPIGDLLASMDIGAMVSVLVVQQYVPAAPQPDSPENSVKQYVNRADNRGRT